MKKNLVLERELVWTRTELEKALKWNNLFQEQTSSKQGLEHYFQGGKAQNISSPVTTSNESNIHLCLCYGRNGHKREKCPSGALTQRGIRDSTTSK